MKDQTPQTIASATSIVRDHSPYCEATGPIVREGFVAARVQAIQGRYDGAQQKTSHSPMTPCPIPSRLQSADTTRIPKPALSSGLSTARLRRDVTRQPATRLFHSQEPKCNAFGTIMHTDTLEVAVGGPALEQANPENKPISSPQAIPPNLANPSGGWVSSYHQEGHLRNSAGSGQPLRPCRSVADKLGSLVDRGWVGCDVFGKAYNDRHASDPYAPSRVSEQRAVYKSRSQSVGSHEQTLPLRKCSRLHENTYPRIDDYSPTKKESLFSEDNDPDPIRYSRQRPRGHGIRQDNDSKVYTDNSSLEAYESKAPVTNAHFSTNKHRAWTLHYPDCSKDCRSEQIELRKLSLSQEIDRHLSEWEYADSTDAEHPEAQQTTRTCSRVDDLKDQSDLATCPELATCPSPVPSIQSSRLSSATTQQSKPSASRSTSWFTKLAGFKLVLIDKNPVIRDLSRRTSEPAVSTDLPQHQQQRQPEHPTLALDKAEVIGNGCIFWNNEQGCMQPICGPSHLKESPEVHDGHDVNIKNTVDVPKSEDSTGTTGNTHHADVNSMSASGLRSSGVTSPLVRKLTSFQLRPHSGHGESKQSVASLETCQPTKHSYSASKKALATFVENTPQKRPTSPTSEHVLEDVTEQRQKHSPETVTYSFRPETPTSLHYTDEQPAESPQSVHWEAAGRGRGIKRVRVIVSLDGADDLIMEAKLLRRLKEDSESPVEQVQDLKGAQNSSSSNQGLL